MKNKIFAFTLLLGASLSLTCCAPSEEDDLFDKSAAERLNEIREVYSKRLMASPNGWAMQLYPTLQDEAPYGSGFLLLMDFDEDYSVKVAMCNELTYNSFTKEYSYWEDRSPWDIIKDNGPVLSFNGHNRCIHTFSDPEDIPSTGDAEHPNNEQGEGFGGDYEFIVVDAPDDASYMMLKGKKRGTYNLLTPLEQGVDYETYLRETNAFMSKMFSASKPTFDVAHFGDSICKMSGAEDGLPNIYPYDGDAVTQSVFNPFLMTKRGNDFYMRFRDAVATDENNVKIQDFRYDTTKDIFESVENPNYYFEGDNPARFFMATTDNIWFFNEEKSSEHFVTILNSVKDDIKAASSSSARYSFERATLRMVDGKPTLQVVYTTRISKQGTTMASVNYAFNIEQNGDNVRFTYLAPTGTTQKDITAAEGALTQFPTIKDLINYFSQEFTVGSVETRFMLNELRFSPGADNGKSVVLSFS